MELSSSKPTLEIVSVNYSKRPGIKFVGTILVLGWRFCISWTVDAAQLVDENFIGAISLFSCILALVIFLSIQTVRYMRRTFNFHRVEIVDGYLIYKEIDIVTKQRSWAKIDLDHVVSAEYNARRDSATLTLKGDKGGMLELPLWTFEECGKELIHYLQSHGVRTNTDQFSG